MATCSESARRARNCVHRAVDADGRYKRRLRTGTAVSGRCIGVTAAAILLMDVWGAPPCLAQAGRNGPDLQSVATASRPAPALKDRIVGAWRLVSIYEENELGEDIALFGTDPRGLFIATRDGRFSLQIVSHDGRRLAGDRQTLAVADDSSSLREALAYYGVYSLGEARGMLTLQVAYCLLRSCDGSRRNAFVAFDGDRMTFTSVVGQTPTGSAHSFLTWERER